MRISDWSSDVCSSDLLYVQARQLRDRRQPAHRQRQCHGVAGQRLSSTDAGRAAEAVQLDQGLHGSGIAQLPGCRLVQRREVREADVQGTRGTEGSTQRPDQGRLGGDKSEEHTSELQSVMRTSYDVL